MSSNWKTNKDRAQLVAWLAVFLLPWQARWIIVERQLSGERYEYGMISVYASMVVVAIACVMLWKRRSVRPGEYAVRPDEYSTRLRVLRAVPAAACGVWLLVLIVRAEDSLLALWFVLTAVIAGGYYYIARNAQRDVVMAAVLAVGVVQATIAWLFFIQQYVPASTLLGVATHSPEVLGQSVVMIFGSRILRAYGTLPHPNVLGGFMAIVCLVALREFIRVGTGRGTRAWARHLFIVLLTFSCLLISFSRAAMAGLIVGGVLWAVLEYSTWHSEYRRRAAQALLACGALLVVFSLITGGAWLNRFNASAGSSTDALEQRSVSERIASYHEARVVAANGNVVFGIGPGNYVVELAQAFPSLPIYTYQPVHNAYIIAGLEIGMIGFILLVWLAIRLFSKNVSWSPKQVWLRIQNNVSRFTPLIILLIVALLDHYPWTLYVGQSLVWLTVGMAVAKRVEAPRQ